MWCIITTLYVLQDTVIAVQALSGLGGKLYAPNFQMTVNTKGGTWAAGAKFTVNNQNALVLQNKDVSNNRMILRMFSCVQMFIHVFIQMYSKPYFCKI